MNGKANPVLFLQAWQRMRRSGSPVAIAEATLAGLDQAIGHLIGDVGTDDLVDDGHADLLAAIDALLRGKAATAQEIIDVATRRGSHEAICVDLALRETVRALGTALHARWLGHLLGKYQGARVGDDKRLIAAGLRNHSRLWRIAAPKKRA